MRSPSGITRPEAGLKLQIVLPSWERLNEMFAIDVDEFIRSCVTGRSASLFAQDMEANREAMRREIEGRSALVIGGAGSIGSAFIKTLLPYQLNRLYVIDTNENGLAELTRDLRSSHGVRVPADYRTYPFNFGDPLLGQLLNCDGPFDIVANFAAHKHVRSEKDVYSIAAMLENNVLRNHRLMELLTEYPPRHLFCVSTDKAANPVNVMGASKKLMEEVLLAYAEELPVVTARFANVAFSQGSLLDGFLHRLQKRQPLSAPRDVRRYFVSPQESGQLCLLACLLGCPGDVFFPRLLETEMKTFSTIAEELLRVVGLRPELCDSEDAAKSLSVAMGTSGGRWPVHFFDSDTSGEKPFEEFCSADEQADLTRFQAIGVIRRQASFSRARIAEVMVELRDLLHKRSPKKCEIVAVLGELLPEFRHLETGRSLDEKM